MGGQLGTNDDSAVRIHHRCMHAALFLNSDAVIASTICSRVTPTRSYLVIVACCGPRRWANMVWYQRRTWAEEATLYNCLNNHCYVFKKLGYIINLDAKCKVKNPDTPQPKLFSQDLTCYFFFYHIYNLFDQATTPWASSSCLQSARNGLTIFKYSNKHRTSILSFRLLWLRIRPSRCHDRILSSHALSHHETDGNCSENVTTKGWGKWRHACRRSGAAERRFHVKPDF